MNDKEQPFLNQYWALVYLLMGRSSITPDHVRQLIALEHQMLEGRTDFSPTYKARVSQALADWQDGSYYLVYQEAMMHAFEARAVLKDPELTKFWLRCSDAVLDVPLFPDSEYYESMERLLAHTHSFNPPLVELTMSALAYNQALLSPNLNEEQLTELRQIYHTQRDEFLRLSGDEFT